MRRLGAPAQGHAGIPAPRAASGPPAGPAEALERDLARWGQRARALLVALAWSRGPGLPAGDIWAAVAQALAPRATLDAQPDGHDDEALLLRRARGYLAEETDSRGRPRYRLRDSLLATALRGEQPGGTPRHTAPEGLITDALIATIPVRAGEREWAEADPYLRAHLAEHAAAAGRPALLGLLRDQGFLACADPATLMPLLDLLDPEFREATRVYRRAARQFGEDPHANSAYLAEAARAVDAATAGRAAANGGLVRAPWPLYRTRLVSVARDDSMLTLTGHTGMVNGIAWGVSPDGKPVLASASDDQTVRLWDLAAGGPAGPPLEPHAGWLCEVALTSTADGMVLATAGDDRLVRLWDPLSRKPIGKPLAGHTDGVLTLAFGTTTDGRLLLASGGRDNTVRVWDPLAGSPVGELLTRNPHWTNDVAFGTTPDGRLLLATASASNLAEGLPGMLRVWDPLTGKPIGEPLTGHPRGLVSVTFGTVQGGGQEGGGRLLLVSGGGTDDHTIRVWDPLTGEPIGEPLTGHTKAVFDVTLGTVKGGRGGGGRLLLVSVSLDGTVRVWDPLTGAAIGEPLAGHTNTAFTASLGNGKDGELLLATAGADTTVRIWDPLASTTPATLPCAGVRLVESVALSGTARQPDAPLLLASADGDEGTVRIWNALEGPALGEPLASGANALEFAAAPDGRLLLAAGGGDRVVRLRDPLTGALVGEPLRGHTGQVRCLALSGTPDGGLLLASAGDDKTIRLWDPLTGTLIGEPLAGHESWVDAVAVTVVKGERSGQGRWAEGGGGLLLASAGGDRAIRLWNPLTGAMVGEPLTGHTGAVRSVAFTTSPAGDLLLASASDDKTIRLWDPLAGTLIGEPLEGHTSWVRALKFTCGPGNRALLVSGSGDRSIRLWDPAAGSCLLTLRRRSTIRSVAAAGLILAIGDDEGVSVIELDSRAIRQQHSATQHRHTRAHPVAGVRGLYRRLARTAPPVSQRHR